MLPTVQMAAALCWDRVAHPNHLAGHLLVPVEMAKHPRHARAWLRDRFGKRNAIEQGVPWISWPCIDFLTNYLKPEHKVFEWGGGGSTVFFLAKGCTVTTIESNEFWLLEIERRLSPDLRKRWSLRFVAADSNEDPRAELYVAGVEDGKPWDVVLVDGWNRNRCLDRAKNTVRPGGLLVLDNADHAQFATVPQRMAGWQRLEFRGLGPSRTWVTRTDIFIKCKP